MSITIKILLHLFIGLLAGITVWPIAEWLHFVQWVFNSYLLYSLLLGGLTGGIFGAFFGIAERLTKSSAFELKQALISGTLIGMSGGIAGFLIAQFILFLLGGASAQIYVEDGTQWIAFIRSIGWAVLGVFLGIIEGIRSKSVKKTIAGAIAGLIGGFAGGLLIEYMKVHLNDLFWIRVAGFSLLGGTIGLIYGVLEKKWSRGVIKVLNGSKKGKEYPLLDMKNMVGSSPVKGVCLDEYTGLEAEHATFVYDQGEYYLQPDGDDLTVFINDKEAGSQRLKQNDIVQLGDVKLQFRYK